MEEWDKEECKIGKCDRCNKNNVKVVADGYIIGFLCEGCYKHVYAIN